MKRLLFLAIMLVAGFGAAAQNNKLENKQASNFNNIYDMLQRQPGVVLNNSTDPPSIIIRGIGTNSSATSPMFMIDGVQVTESQVSSLTPQEVWSIEVVKDGSAGFYGGMESANGVIMIETMGHHEVQERAAEQARAEKAAAREARKAARQNRQK